MELRGAIIFRVTRYYYIVELESVKEEVSRKGSERAGAEL